MRGGTGTRSGRLAVQAVLRYCSEMKDEMITAAAWQLWQCRDRSNHAPDGSGRRGALQTEEWNSVIFVKWPGDLAAAEESRSNLTVVVNS